MDIADDCANAQCSLLFNETIEDKECNWSVEIRLSKWTRPNFLSFYVVEKHATNIAGRSIDGVQIFPVKSAITDAGMIRSAIQSLDDMAIAENKTWLTQKSSSRV